MAYENKLCWRWKHSNMNVGHDCCVLLFSASSPLRITVPELTYFTKLPSCKLLCAPFHIPCYKKGRKKEKKNAEHIYNYSCTSVCPQSTQSRRFWLYQTMFGIGKILRTYCLLSSPHRGGRGWGCAQKLWVNWRLKQDLCREWISSIQVFWRKEKTKCVLVIGR